MEYVVERHREAQRRAEAKSNRTQGVWGGTPTGKGARPTTEKRVAFRIDGLGDDWLSRRKRDPRPRLRGVQSQSRRGRGRASECKRETIKLPRLELFRFRKALRSPAPPASHPTRCFCHPVLSPDAPAPPPSDEDPAAGRPVGPPGEAGVTSHLRVLHPTTAARFLWPREVTFLASGGYDVDTFGAVFQPGRDGWWEPGVGSLRGSEWGR